MSHSILLGGGGPYRRKRLFPPRFGIAPAQEGAEVVEYMEMDRSVRLANAGKCVEAALDIKIWKNRKNLLK